MPHDRVIGVRHRALPQNLKDPGETFARLPVLRRNRAGETVDVEVIEKRWLDVKALIQGESAPRPSERSENTAPGPHGGKLIFVP